jgi:hypothetical protein
LTGRADFWSRRKAKVEAEARAEARAAEAAEAAAREAALAEKTDEQICEELGLPDPDTLGAGDDFRAFMSRAVPERLRRRALRRLWTSNPVLANLDGLIDYGEDYTDTACVIENLKTTYQVGKGMFAHVEEMARQAEARAAAEAPGAAPEPEAVALAEPEPEPEAEEPAPEPPARTDAAQAGPDGDEHPALPPRRRMRFAFDHRAGSHA